jgi:hypothetical protein
MESVVDIMKANNIQWAKEWPFDPIVSMSFGIEDKEEKDKEIIESFEE